jgi:hypothetical protein
MFITWLPNLFLIISERKIDTAMVSSSFDATQAKTVKEVNANLISKSDYFLLQIMSWARYR